VIVIAGRPQQAVHAGGDDRQPPCWSFLFWKVYTQENVSWNGVQYKIEPRICILLVLKDGECKIIIKIKTLLIIEVFSWLPA